jgi:hypothetical protein
MGAYALTCRSVYNCKEKTFRKNAVNLQQDLALENRSSDFNNIPQELSKSEFMHL